MVFTVSEKVFGVEASTGDVVVRPEDADTQDGTDDVPRPCNALLLLDFFETFTLDFAHGGLRV